MEFGDICHICNLHIHVYENKGEGSEVMLITTDQGKGNLHITIPATTAKGKLQRRTDEIES